MTDTERIKELEEEVGNLGKQIEHLKKENATLNLENNDFKNGCAKMYYSLERKNSEISKMLNSVKLDEIDVKAKSDSSFERVMKVIEKAESIGNASRVFAQIAGITGNEEEDINKPLRKPMTAESVADSLGNIAGSKKQ
jgi:regulator of replication initiation timing